MVVRNAVRGEEDGVARRHVEGSSQALHLRPVPISITSAPIPRVLTSMLARPAPGLGWLMLTSAPCLCRNVVIAC
jgi:hypothetical protein